MCKRALQGGVVPVDFYGLLRSSEQKDVVRMLETQCYQHWDLSPTSPAKQRPADSTVEAPLQFSILTWVNGKPGFPAELLTKFQAGTPEHGEMLKLKQEFLALAPDSAEPAPTTGSDAAANAPV